MGYVYGSKSERSVCSRAYILRGFQTFYLVGCFVMGRLWWLIFRGGNVMFDGVVCFYRDFVHDAFIQAFSW